MALLVSPTLLFGVLVGAGWGGQALLRTHLRTAAQIAIEAAALGQDPVEQERLALAALNRAVWAPLRRHVHAEVRAREDGVTLTVGCDVRHRAPATVAAILALPPVNVLTRSEPARGTD